MSVTEKLMAPGVFNVQLDLELVPNQILNAIQPYDQIIITDGPMETQDFVDSVMLPSAEYIGIVQSLGMTEKVSPAALNNRKFYKQQWWTTFWYFKKK